ncbi:uncharacterized protein LOC129910943 [Episyrphus balteatus]|uniref:uncharacterized protein LOC129910943 n=1 Tax=Episyrphus balteatus TaxID=286459 RepID=UPI002484D9EC|nr:uncharacterized protein LOC129910943 [Episyrphus balteatus]
MENLGPIVRFFSQAAGTFFIIIIDDIDISTLHQIFEKLWKFRGIYRVLLLTLDGVMVYNPFKYDAITEEFGGIEFFEHKNIVTLFDNMNGYPLRVQIFKSVYARPIFNTSLNKMVSMEGADAQVALELQRSMNFTMILQRPSKDYFGERAANGSYNGAIGMIINSETDISLTGFFIKDYHVPIEFTATVYDDQLCCYVPKAEQIPASILPICALRPSFWLTFILAGFICGTVWIIFRVLNLRFRICSKNYKSRNLSPNLRYQFIRIFNDTWVAWVKSNLTRFPPFNSERMFLISICLVSVILGAIIESSLATVYIHPMYYQDINNLHELDESGLDIVYKYTSFKDDLFFSETSPLFAALNKKLRYLGDLDADLIQHLANHRDIASVTRYSSLILESNDYILKKKIHVVEECPKHYMIAYAMPKDSPFGEKINQLLLRFLNGGLINKWIADMHAKADRLIMSQMIIHGNSAFKVLTLVDLQLAFYVVVLGSLLSMILLGAEIYWKYRQRNGNIVVDIQID